MQKFLNLLLASFIGATLIACVETTDEKQPSKQTTSNNYVGLQDLQASTPPEKWDSFFIEHMGQDAWERTKGQINKSDYLWINFNQVAASSKQIDELTTALIRYLKHYKISIKTLSLEGSDRDPNKQLQVLSEEIGDLVNLESLIITNNQLKQLPITIGNLNILRTLNLSRNYFSNLPPEIIQLTNLDELNLSHNQLTDIPSALSTITSLQSINVSNNQLRTLPAQLGHLSWRLDKLEDNPWLRPEDLDKSLLVSQEVLKSYATKITPLSLVTQSAKHVNNNINQAANEEQKQAITNKLPAELFYKVTSNSTIDGKQLIYFKLIEDRPGKSGGMLMPARFPQEFPFHWDKPSFTEQDVQYLTSLQSEKVKFYLISL